MCVCVCVFAGVCVLSDAEVCGKVLQRRLAVHTRYDIWSNLSIGKKNCYHVVRPDVPA